MLALGGGTGGTCNSDEVQIAVGGLTFSSGNLTATFIGPGSAFFVQVP